MVVAWSKNFQNHQESSKSTGMVNVVEANCSCMSHWSVCLLCFVLSPVFLCLFLFVSSKKGSGEPIWISCTYYQNVVRTNEIAKFSLTAVKLYVYLAFFEWFCATKCFGSKCQQIRPHYIFTKGQRFCSASKYQAASHWCFVNLVTAWLQKI